MDDDKFTEELKNISVPELRPELKREVLGVAEKEWNKEEFPWRFISGLAALFVLSFTLNMSIDQVQKPATQVNEQEYKQLEILIAKIRGQK
ncbi:MAG: hypothetical protein NE334_18965 [Lentisphaeraceae bacterium]|nr:hypothetical protein [Lentisphaeraceae bacterium]